METTRFDQIASSFAQTHSRRGAFRLLAASATGASGLTVFGHDESQAKKRRKKKGGKGKGGKGSGAGTGGSVRGLRQICLPGHDTCSSGLQCGAPTTRHTCSSTVEGVEAWCCVPPGGQCSECDCCGNFYCSYDDNNVGHCVPNPER